MIEKKTTRDLLSDSVHELAEKKPMDKITVKEIAQNCGLTGATFYNHFKDKYDLIAWIFNNQVEKAYIGYVDGTRTWRETIEAVIHIMYEDRGFYKNALANTSGQNSFFYSTHLYSVNLLRDVILRKAGSKATADVLFCVDFYIRGSSITITEWMTDGCIVPPDKLAGLLYEVIPVPLQAYLSG